MDRDDVEGSFDLLFNCWYLQFCAFGIFCCLNSPHPHPHTHTHLPVILCLQLIRQFLVEVQQQSSNKIFASMKY